MPKGAEKQIDDILPPAEDVKKVERRLASEEKKVIIWIIFYSWTALRT